MSLTHLGPLDYSRRPQSSSISNWRALWPSHRSVINLLDHHQREISNRFSLTALQRCWPHIQTSSWSPMREEPASQAFTFINGRSVTGKCRSAQQIPESEFLEPNVLVELQW